MKAFDLAAAQRGDPVWVRASRSDPWYESAWFIGVTKKGRPIMEWPDGDARAISDVEGRLCMAPKKRTVYVNLYPESLASGQRAVWHATKGSAEELATSNAIAIAVPVEVEE